MPWKETHAVDERVRFIAAVQDDPQGNFSRLCASFGISRAKGYKWLARYRDFGPSGLEDRGPVARHCPHATAEDVVDKILALRKQHPFEGPKKLRARLLELEPTLAVPAASTIGDILKRMGMIRPRRRRLHAPPGVGLSKDANVAPNDVWAADFKGHFLCGDKRRCYPLTVSDVASRYLLKCEGLHLPRNGPVKQQFERAFQEFGLPLRIRTDNGPPFASLALGGLSHLSVWWLQLGITPERIDPGQPQQNGRHERMHKTLKEQTASPPAATFTEQQRAFDLFRRDYNDARPHEALGQQPPKRFYEPSPRLMPSRLRRPEYDTDVSVRMVNNGGLFGWKGTWLKAGNPLANQAVGLRRIDEEEWELLYGPVLLGYVVGKGKKLTIEPLTK